MAKTGINISRCNVSSAEEHNGRDKSYIKAVNESPNKKYDLFADRTETNITWKNPEYEGKTLPQVLDEMREIYREHVGQSPQEDDRIRQITDKKTGMKREVVTPGWAPIREGVCPVQEDTTIKNFKHFQQWLENKGPKIIRIDIHRDEGHIDLISGERKYNCHAHLIIDWLDHKSGKTFKLSKLDAAEMQTQLALSLNMERGEAKTTTSADHLSPDEFRAKAVAEDIIRLSTLKAEVTDGLRESCNALQEIGKDTVHSFDKILANGGGAVKPTIDEKANRDRLELESNQDFSNLTFDDLRKKTTTLRTLITCNNSAINRIGTKLRELAAKLPDTKFHLLSSSATKAKILAINAQKESEVEKVRTEAEEAVKRAENDKEEAIRNTEATVQRVLAEKNEFEKEYKKNNEAALKQKQEAEEKARALSQRLAKMDADLAAANEKGRQAGYSAGLADGVSKAKSQLESLQEELEATKEKLHSTDTWKEYFRKTNIYLAHAEQHYKELKNLKEWPLSDEEIQQIFEGKIIKKQHSVKRNGKTINIPVNIEIAKDTKENVRIWYNDTSKEECKRKLDAEVVKLSRGSGISR